MNAVFAHDHVFSRCPDGTRYTPGQLPYSVLKRYLRFFNSLTVVARERQVARKQDCAALNEASGENVRFHAVPSLSTPIGRIRDYAAARETIRHLIAESDAVIARLPSEIGSLAFQVADRLGKPVAVEVVACPWDALWNYGTLLGRVYAPVAYARTRRQVRRAPFAIYVSRQFLPGRYPSAGTTACVSDVQIAPVPRDVLERRLEKLERHTGPVRLGLIGSLTRYKGLDTAFKALSMLRGTTPPIRLSILGAGDPEPWKRLAHACGVERAVEFCGVLPAGDAVRAWLDEIDIYIQPSRQEGLPRALVEAMSRACPCIGSTAGGIPELLEANCLHAPGIASALAHLLTKRISDREWQLEQARRNFREAQHYTREILDEQWGHFWSTFADVAQRKTRGRPEWLLSPVPSA